MSWILALVGALLGGFAAAADDVVWGVLGGTLVGALLGQASRLRARVGVLEKRLNHLESLYRNAAEQLGVTGAARGATPRAAANVSPAAAPPPAATPASAPVAPRPVAAAAPPPAVASAPIPPATSAAPPPREAPPRPAPQPMFEPAPPRGPDVFERLVATVRGWLFEGNVPVKLGLLVLMFGVAAALKYAADAGWLRMPIEFRLAGIAAGAIAGLVWGLRSARERPAFGLSLQGGAIGILLLVAFAAFRRYELLAAMPAFALVVILVAGASVLAVRQNAPALAVLGFIGGYLAPVLISTGSGNHVALFSYFAVLNTAVFLIAWKRPWRALNLVGFGFTFAIGGLWGGKYYRPELFATVEPFLVLFFLFYVAIPVLYALAGRERNGRVDGTLLFGTPLLAFPMQVGLLEGDRMALAASAVFVAGVYALLAVWAVRNPRLRLLAQSTAALGVVFATLAIPLALEARWTSAAWALQGLGMVWLGLRQDRRLAQGFGLLLMALAGCAWGFSQLDHDLSVSDRFLLNTQALNLGLLAFAHLGAAWLYHRAGKATVLGVVLFVIGLGWWTLLGVREVLVNLEHGREFDHLLVALAGFAAVTGALCALLRRPLAWPWLAWPLATAVLLALPLAMFDLMVHAEATWFAAPWLGWWLVAGVLLVSLRALREPPLTPLPLAHIALGLLVAFGVGSSLQRLAEDHWLLGDGWQWPLLLAPLALLAIAAWRRPATVAWPAGERFAGYRAAWLALAGILLGLAWLGVQFAPGDSTPLPWLPLLNPLELMIVAALVLAAKALRGRPGASLAWSAWAGAAWLALTLGVLRACHQLAMLPWSPEILSSRLAQASLTVAWCVAGVVAWILGSRRRNRVLWWFGAGLLGVVLLKLLVVDRQFLGNVTGIVSFVAVGLLLIVVGRIAPTPPRPQE